MTEVLIAPEESEVEVLSHNKTRSSGILVETKDNKVNALHAVCERAGGGFDYFRYDRGAGQWRGPLASAGTKGNVLGPVVFRGMNYALDVLYREVGENRELPSGATGTLYHSFSTTYYQSPDYPWVAGRWELPEAKEVNGTAAVCRWDEGNQGLEVIAPVASGGFRHWYRNSLGTWYTTGKQYSNQFSGLAMVIGSGKWLYIAAVETNGTLWAIHRDGSQKWHSKDLGKAFTGQPALVESGRNGVTWDLVVPNATGPLIHYEITSWFTQREAARFGVPGRVYREVGLVYNHAGQLEAVARPAAGGPLEHYINRFDGKGWVAGMPFPAVNAQGSWNVQYDLGAIGIHSTVLHTNEVAAYGMADNNDHHAKGSFINLSSGQVTPMPPPMPHVFCSGQAQLPNGDLLVAGGHTGSEHELHKLTRSGSTWKWAKLPDLNHGRWYPTVTTLNDGKMLIIAGAYHAGEFPVGLNNSYEIFDPANETGKRERIDLWKTLGEKFCDDFNDIDMYPFVYVLPNKRVFVHSRYTTRFFDYPKTGKDAWSGRIVANFKSPRTYRYQGTAVLLPMEANASNEYPSAKVLLLGGAGSVHAGIDTPASDSVEVMETSAPTPAWTSLSKLPVARVMPEAVLLPDGKVLVVAGSRAGRGDGCMSRQPVLRAEMFDPEQQTFSEVAPMRVPRLYHTAAVLLPDARVLVTGKCKVFNAAPYDYPEHRGEVYTPAYLLNGKPRPVITEAPAQIKTAEAKFDVKVSGVAPSDIKSIVLIRPGAATHSVNMDQRSVSIPFTAAADKLTATAPKTNWVVPPGYYMLFVVSRDGVPSEAKFVQVSVF